MNLEQQEVKTAMQYTIKLKYFYYLCRKIDEAV